MSRLQLMYLPQEKDEGFFTSHSHTLCHQLILGHVKWPFHLPTPMSILHWKAHHEMELILACTTTWQFLTWILTHLKVENHSTKVGPWGRRPQPSSWQMKPKVNLWLSLFVIFVGIIFYCKIAKLLGSMCVVRTMLILSSDFLDSVCPFLRECPLWTLRKEGLIM